VYDGGLDFYVSLTIDHWTSVQFEKTSRFLRQSRARQPPCWKARLLGPGPWQAWPFLENQPMQWVLLSLSTAILSRGARCPDLPRVL